MESRVTGVALEEAVNVHSSTLGDIKFSWADVCTIDCTADDGKAHVSAANGDELIVRMTGESLRLQTEFGKTSLPLKMVTRIEVAPVNYLTPPVLNGDIEKSKLQLSVELRDGSHLVGKALEDTVGFHSSLLGDAQLPWTRVRSISLAATGTDAAELRSASGDILPVKLSASTIPMDTSFGKVELPVKEVLRIRISTQGDGGDHLVGWWKLDEGTGTVAKDSSAGENRHDGQLTNGPAWTATRNDMALRFGGSSQYVALGNTLSGEYKEISIGCWVKHGKAPILQTLVERSTWDQPDGIGLFVNASGTISFGHYQQDAMSHATVDDDHWHHVMGTMSRNGDDWVYCVYVDGRTRQFGEDFDGADGHVE